jgi:hypothetical protein
MVASIPFYICNASEIEISERSNAPCWPKYLKTLVIKVVYLNICKNFYVNEHSPLKASLRLQDAFLGIVSPTTTTTPTTTLTRL